MIETFHRSLPWHVLADNHGFGMFSQRIDQNVRMGGNNELSAFSGCDQQISYLGKNVGMQTKLRFFML